jgi:nicotinate-nucleotide adenylyltransferase
VPAATPSTDEILHPAEPPLVFCPLGFERRCFLRFGKLPVVATGPGEAAIRRAFAERDAWPVRRPRLLILVGLAGGLTDRVRAGEAAVVSEVVSLDGAAPLTSRLGAEHVAIAQAPHIVSSVDEKRRLASRSGADLVDTESRAFAECAADAGIPWAIVRGVSDDASQALPPELAGLVDERGVTRPARIAAALLSRPGLISDLIRIGRTARAAMRSAAFAADALGCLDAIALCSPERPLVLFGGSFDPPHVRHAEMLAQAVRVLRAPSAMVMPAALNPLKSGTPPADCATRIAMCRANFDGAQGPFPAELRLSRLECSRDGPSYTIDTIHALLARRPGLAGAIRFLVGSDAIRSIERWHRWRDLLRVATPAVVVRPPDTRAATEAFLEGFAAAHGFADARSWLLDIEPVDLSSTDIRGAVARGERPAGLADGVWREIAARGLYDFGGAR